MGSIGYARVGPREQNADLQHTRLRIAGYSRIFTNHGVSGAVAGRLVLDKLFDYLREGNAHRGVGLRTL